MPQHNDLIDALYRGIDWNRHEENWRATMVGTNTAGNALQRMMTQRREEQAFEYERFRDLAGGNTDIMITPPMLEALLRNIRERADINPNIREDLEHLQIDGINILVDEPNEEAEEEPVERAGPFTAQEAVRDYADRLAEALPQTDQRENTIEALAERYQAVLGHQQQDNPEPPQLRPDEYYQRQAGQWAATGTPTPEEILVTNLHNAVMTREQLEHDIIFTENRVDYDRRLRITGELRLRVGVNTTVIENNEIPYRDLMRRDIVDQFYRRLNPEPTYTFTDDELRDFIFWMHKNISAEKRAEADKKFNEMRSRIWPDVEAVPLEQAEELE